MATDATLQSIHAAEFAVHLGLHACAPVWLHLFGAEVDPARVDRLSAHLISSETALSHAQVEGMAETAFGPAGVAWMRDVFLSHGVPRIERQRRVMLGAVAPSLSTDTEAPARTALLAALSEAPLAELAALEALMDALERTPADPRDEALLEGATTLIDARFPARQLLESEYMAIMERALTARAAPA
ncbi:MAG: hypothetical protein AAF714_12030 [Pseudomonadota bacterium]